MIKIKIKKTGRGVKIRDYNLLKNQIKKMIFSAIKEVNISYFIHFGGFFSHKFMTS